MFNLIKRIIYEILKTFDPRTNDEYGEVTEVKEQMLDGAGRLKITVKKYHL